MNHSSEHRPDFLRDKLIGLGENSIRKNYYPELQKRLAELENFRNLLDKVSDGILMAKVPAGTIVDANEAACILLGIETNHIDAAPLTEFFPSTRSLLQVMDSEAGLPSKRQEFFVEFRRGDGSRVPLDVSVDVVALGAQLFAVVLLRDISERQRADAMLRHVSTHDPLTGLYNRAYLEYEFQRRRDFLPVPCLLISCDIDGLKMTNETLGPAAGDQRLIVAGILMSELVVTVILPPGWVVTSLRCFVPAQAVIRRNSFAGICGRQWRHITKATKICSSACPSGMPLLWSTRWN